MSSFLQTVTGDLAITLGKLSLVTDPSTAGAQKIRNQLNIFLGEWYLDARVGVPYFSQVFVENPDIGLIQQLIRGIILNTAGVQSVQRVTVSVNRADRSMLIKFAATWDNGVIVTSDQLDQPFLVQIPNNNTVAN